jgi:hypothetical protein
MVLLFTTLKFVSYRMIKGGIRVCLFSYRTQGKFLEGQEKKKGMDGNELKGCMLIYRCDKVAAHPTIKIIHP